mmetsp:Transcript_22330/g.71446  ORF Transcript_22330/g.71446 Transcript_22330/m.71446 type:complete len:278 (-) Transcript_22330:783-1616(-)
MLTRRCPSAPPCGAAVSGARHAARARRRWPLRSVRCAPKMRASAAAGPSTSTRTTSSCCCTGTNGRLCSRCPSLAGRAARGSPIGRTCTAGCRGRSAGRSRGSPACAPARASSIRWWARGRSCSRQASRTRAPSSWASTQSLPSSRPRRRIGSARPPSRGLTPPRTLPPRPSSPPPTRCGVGRAPTLCRFSTAIAPHCRLQRASLTASHATYPLANATSASWGSVASMHVRYRRSRVSCATAAAPRCSRPTAQCSASCVRPTLAGCQSHDTRCNLAR